MGIHVLKHLKEELAWVADIQFWVISNLKQLTTKCIAV